MTTTTDVVQRSPFWKSSRRHGYFFREVAMLTIAIGFFLHLYRVIFGDDLAMKYRDEVRGHTDDRQDPASTDDVCGDHRHPGVASRAIHKQATQGVLHRIGVLHRG